MLFIPAAIGAIGSIVGGLIGSRQSRGNIRRQARHDSAFAEQAYSRDLEMWKRQNEYNHPTQQMARLKEAGLNPALVYGQGAIGNTAGQMPKYQQVRTDYSKQQAPLDPLAVLSAFQDFKMKNAQINLVEKEAELRGAEAQYGDIFFQGRANKTFSNAEMDFSRMRHLMGKGYIDREGVWHGPDSKLMKYHEYQLQQREQNVRSTQIGADIKALEKEWLEWMKKAGIGAKLGVPLLRMFLNVK